MSDFDVVVIGAGPAGAAAAELAGVLGYSVALAERDVVGGTVVTSGGAPTKAFREAAAYLSAFEKEKTYGVALSAPPEVMYPAIRDRAREVSEQLMQATLERLSERGVQLVSGEGRLDTDHSVMVRASDGTERRLRAGRVIIATGSRPLRPPGVPFDDPHVADSETIADMTHMPRELVIVGGGAIGIEYATIFSALGSSVTILDSAPRLAAMMDGEISRRLEQVVRARGNQVILGTGMVSVRRDGEKLAIELDDGRQLRHDALLFAAGRTVSTAGLGLEESRRRRRPARPDHRRLRAADHLPVGVRRRRCHRALARLNRHRPGTASGVRSHRS